MERVGHRLRVSSLSRYSFTWCCEGLLVRKTCDSGLHGFGCAWWNILVALSPLFGATWFLNCQANKLPHSGSPEVT